MIPQTGGDSVDVNPGVSEKFKSWLPVVRVTNVKSLLPKIQSVVDEMKESEIDILLISEKLEK